MKKIDTGISVVVPVYNSENTISELVSRLRNVLCQFGEYEIILVNDKSTDNSWEAIKREVQENETVVGVSLCENCGQQSAILCGLRQASFDLCVIIDDDLEQSPEDIIRLYEKLLEGYDVVYGIAEYAGLRSFGSYMRDILFRMLTNIPKGIKVSSLRIMNRKTREAIIRANTEFVYISMEILNVTRNIANIDINKGANTQSNYTFSKLVALYKNILRTYSKYSLFGQKTIGECYNIDKVVRNKK